MKSWLRSSKTHSRPSGGLACLFAAAALLLLLTDGAGLSAPKRAGGMTPAQVIAAAPKIPRDADLYWQRAKLEIYKSAAELKAQNEAEMARGLRYPKLMHGDPRRRQVALTFDDGPHPGYTIKILEILKQYNVHATFFLVGEQAERYPYLVRAEAAAGHTVANHTYHHVDLTKIPFEAIATEIKACGEVLRDITGKSPSFFRPPGGDYDRQVAQLVGALGYTMVLWTDNPGDYEMPTSQVLEARVLNRIRRGGIVLLHDGIQQTIDVLPDILKYLRTRGYQMVTVEDMVAGGAKASSRSGRGGRS
jgi:peptidoglycan/xylan/chitin deacetylase (PgdA/CDA1 family)